MLILAIDTALEACSVCVLDTREGEVIALESRAMKRGHAEALMPLIRHMMDKADVAFTALDRIAVTTGPGSFTGLGVGLSAARGISLAAPRPAVAVPPAPPCAAPIAGLGRGRPVTPATDARHDHVYYQVVAGDGS